MGDQMITIEADPYFLRLTLGALAEISESLSAAGPKALAQQMNALSMDKVLIVLTALLRPIYGADYPPLQQSDIKAEHVKAVAQIFEQSFSVLK